MVLDQRGLIEILSGKAIHVLIADLTGKTENLPESIIASIASTAPTCIIHARDGEPQDW